MGLAASGMSPQESSKVSEEAVRKYDEEQRHRRSDWQRRREAQLTRRKNVPPQETMENNSLCLGHTHASLDARFRLLQSMDFMPVYRGDCPCKPKTCDDDSDDENSLPLLIKTNEDNY